MISLGCAKNRVDAEQMMGLLRDAGCTLTNNPDEADVLIVNTCGFIEPAKEESIGALLEAAEYKQKGRCRLLIAAGCLVQRYASALHADMPEVDAFLGVHELSRVVPLITGSARDAGRPVHCARLPGHFEAPRVLTTPPHTAFVRTGDGCDNRCAYCAIPLIRGPYRSRGEAALVEEIGALAREGVREISLIAQDTTRYGDDLPGRPTLAGLIKSAARVPEIRWIRALYCYPSRVDDALLDTLASESKACAYLDIPLQHIDADILLAMNRRGTPAQIRSVIKRARERGITLRTTMIVGFPGETEDAFSRLLDFVQEVQFDRLGAFPYSAEEDTVAAGLPNQVPEDSKRERLDRLMRLQQRISHSLNKKRVGAVTEALVDRADGRTIVARSRMEAPEGDGVILLNARKTPLPGTFVRARITGAGVYDLTGDVIE
ncbi:MAG: 30S ribosomal protein S12 methylthiotransferase RimO [Clostridia bacterium]|nr:30S ribosomal protein S12 methylthiotransferase RimO [Clostridia bacterium]